MSTRPWEEEWIEWRDGDQYGIRTADGREVFEAGLGTTFGDLSLGAAAPYMAQALLESGTKWNSRNGEWHTFVCEEYGRDECTDDCKAARAALKKARVLP